MRRRNHILDETPPIKTKDLRRPEIGGGGGISLKLWQFGEANSRRNRSVVSEWPSLCFVDSVSEVSAAEMSSSANCGGSRGDAERQCVDGHVIDASGLSAMSDAAAHHQQQQQQQHQQEGHSPSASESQVCGGSGDVCRRLAAIHSLIEQVASEVSAVEPLIMTSIATDQAPIICQKWSSVKSTIPTLSAMSGAVQTIAHHISAAPPPPPCQPDTTKQPGTPHPTTTTTTPTAAAADGDNPVDVTANRLPADVYCDGVLGYLPVDEAISSARGANTHHGKQLINEAFMLKRINGSLDSNHLTGVVDVHRSPFDYYSKCAYALEQGGELLRQQMADFIHLARNHKLIKALPLRLSADSLPTAAAFKELPLALAVYKAFGHLLSHRGTSLALERVEDDDDQSESDQASDDENDDGMDEGGDEEDGDDDIDHQQESGGGDASGGEGPGGDGPGGQPGNGHHGDGHGGGVTRQRYRIGNVDFTTVPLADLPPNHRYRSTYNESDPVIRSGGLVFPSFTAFLKGTVLMEWCKQEGVGEEKVTDAYVGPGDTRYRSLLTAPTIDGFKTVDGIDEHPPQGYDGRERLIIVKGTAANDTITAYLRLVYGRISLWTTEAPTEGRTAIEHYPIAVNVARPVLAKYGLERTVLG
ncbi:unnamed protein product [Vitrella brassicaformis CCMP3155]|uniref:Uncharacterized protein n=1 Tax=Vitrella brassicaformis (strain CCMP3155) TaxID=1169540 RepID=A0A0G4E999_VITBC|nr:unnamed protein product [Vitrella brassicaformis CCMP3155]|eukprot:CEL92161.1 unnamed protein product [Vitrella brassicaformis CCMP3155]